MIPETAVESAKSAVRAHAHVDLEAEHLIEGIVRAALEAAAPHMLAGVWDEGWYERAEYDGAQRIPEETPNPYRSQA